MPEILRPLGDRVLVRPLKPAQREESLLEVDNSGKEDEVLRGVVIAGWEDRSVRPEDYYANGATILYEQYSGHSHKIDGEELLILTEEEILGVIENV